MKIKLIVFFLAIIAYSEFAYAQQSLLTPSVINLGDLPIGDDSSYPQYSLYFAITNNTPNTIEILNMNEEDNSTNNILDIPRYINNTMNKPYIVRLNKQQTYYPTLTFDAKDTGNVIGWIQILYQNIDSTDVDTTYIEVTAYCFKDSNTIYNKSWITMGTEYIFVKQMR